MLTPPSPQKIRTLRASLKLTQQEAADSVHVTLRAWQLWEAGQRTMPAATWELCVIKAGIHPLYSAVKRAQDSFMLKSKQ